jgi:hypothetical protein
MTLWQPTPVWPPGARATTWPPGATWPPSPGVGIPSRAVASDGSGIVSAAFGVQNGAGTPTSPSVGHLLLCSAIASGATNITIAGWTQVVQVLQSSFACTLLSRIATGAEGTVTPVPNAGTITGVTLSEYAGMANPAVIDGTPAGTSVASATSLATAALTTVHANDLIYQVALDATGTMHSQAPPWTTANLILAQDDFHTGICNGEHIVAAPVVGYVDTAHQGAANFMATLVAAFQGS